MAVCQTQMAETEIFQSSGSMKVHDDSTLTDNTPTAPSSTAPRQRQDGFLNRLFKKSAPKSSSSKHKSAMETPASPCTTGAEIKEEKVLNSSLEESSEKERSGQATVDFIAEPTTTPNRSDAPKTKKNGFLSHIKSKISVSPRRGTEHPSNAAATTTPGEADPTDGGANAAAAPQTSPIAAAAAVESPAAEAVEDAVEVEESMQYYCYTDENGDTFYYTTNGDDGEEAGGATGGAPEVPTALPMAEDPTNNLAADATGESYVFEYVDEDGNTVQYVCAPEDVEATEVDCNGNSDDAVGEEEGATAAVVSHIISSSSSGDSSDSLTTGKKKGAAVGFFDAISTAFKSRRAVNSSAEVATRHADPLGYTESQASGDEEEETTGASSMPCTELLEADAAVEAFKQLLDSTELKRFLKERRNLIKELLIDERRSRESLVKQRRVFLQTILHDRSTGAFELRKDERKIKTGIKNSEPL